MQETGCWFVTSLKKPVVTFYLLVATCLLVIFADFLDPDQGRTKCLKKLIKKIDNLQMAKNMQNYPACKK